MRFIAVSSHHQVDAWLSKRARHWLLCGSETQAARQQRHLQQPQHLDQAVKGLASKQSATVPKAAPLTTCTHCQCQGVLHRQQRLPSPKPSACVQNGALPHHMWHMQPSYVIETACLHEVSSGTWHNRVPQPCTEDQQVPAKICAGASASEKQADLTGSVVTCGEQVPILVSKAGISKRALWWWAAAESRPSPAAGTKLAGVAALLQKAQKSSVKDGQTARQRFPYLTERRLRMADRRKRGMRTRQHSTKKPTQTMMAMMPPLLTLDWSMHQCPKCDLQAVPVALLSVEDSDTLCRLVVNEPPLLVMAACVRGTGCERAWHRGSARWRFRPKIHALAEAAEVLTSLQKVPAVVQQRPTDRSLLPLSLCR